jgi:GT2 family glycosyltransferase
MSRCPPDVTVVVTSHDPIRLERLLTSLRSQTLPVDRFEVVVVGSEPMREPVPTHEEGLRVRMVESSAAPVAALDEGWRAAKAPLVAFTTDDCLATPGWLEGGVRAAARSPGALIQGRIELDPAERELSRPFGIAREIHGRTIGSEIANLFLPLALIERLDGFDIGAFPVSGADTDLRWRAVKSGAEAVFADDAVVYHTADDVGAREHLQMTARLAEAIPLLRSHPEARAPGMLRRWFWSDRHWLFVRFVIGLLLPKRFRLVGLMLAAPYIADVSSNRGGPLAIPLTAAVDALDVVTVVRAAVRHRTPVI